MCNIHELPNKSIGGPEYKELAVPATIPAKGTGEGFGDGVVPAF